MGGRAGLGSRTTRLARCTGPRCCLGPLYLHTPETTRTLLAQALILKATGLRMRLAAPCSRAAIPEAAHASTNVHACQRGVSNPRGESASASPQYRVLVWGGRSSSRYSPICCRAFGGFLSLLKVITYGHA
jgi:hypothetical protein